MKLSDVVKGTIKVTGTIAKVGVELGADVVGVIAEKIDDNPEDKEKIVSSGKELGQKIKNGSNNVAEESVEVVDNIVDSGKEIFEDVSQTIKNKTGKKSNKDYKSSSKNSDDIYEEETVEHTYQKSKNNGRTYVTIKSKVETEEIDDTEDNK